MDVKAWVFLELCSVFLQLVFFTPFYLIWRKDSLARNMIFVFLLTEHAWVMD